MRPLSVVRILRLRLWLAALFRPRDLQITLFWAGCVGILGGVAGSGFRAGITFLQWMFTGQTGGLVRTAESLVWWQRLGIPTLGGLAAGLVIMFGGRFTKAQRSSDFMEAIVVSDGVMHPRPILVRCLSSLLTIASGGSIGREGPMVQLAAMLASWLGRLLRLPTPRLRLLVACGVAAGIASAYKAPIAGSLFVAEIVLGSIAMESFGPLVFSAVIATLTSLSFADHTPLYTATGVGVRSPWEFIPYLLLGLLAGGLAPFFLRLLRASSQAFMALALPPSLRLAAGGAVVGAISVFHPEVWGNGYSVVQGLLTDQAWPWHLLAVTLGCKLLATAATVGSGAVGGVFTPTLFVGAVLGLLFERLCQLVVPSLGSDPRAFALVGMGCFLAGTTHAPLMAMIMLFEMTLDYDIVLPLMLACVTAYYTAYGLDRNSIYTEAIERKRQRIMNKMLPVCVGDLLKTTPVSILETAPLVEIANLFARTQINYLYVTDADGRLQGMISLLDIKDFLDDLNLSQLVAAYDIMNDKIPIITPEMSLGEAARQFTTHRGERLPVINSPTSRSLVGSISKTDLLLTLAHGSAAADDEDAQPKGRVS